MSYHTCEQQFTHENKYAQRNEIIYSRTYFKSKWILVVGPLIFTSLEKKIVWATLLCPHACLFWTSYLIIQIFECNDHQPPSPTFPLTPPPLPRMWSRMKRGWGLDLKFAYLQCKKNIIVQKCLLWFFYFWITPPTPSFRPRPCPTPTSV